MPTNHPLPVRLLDRAIRSSEWLDSLLVRAGNDSERRAFAEMVQAVAWARLVIEEPGIAENMEADNG